MVRNPERRMTLLDAGLAVLAREGARGLTHRAVDHEAGAPTGTASNYFRSRAELIDGLVQRIFERLAPDPDVLEQLGRRTPSKALFADYVRDIVDRLTTHRDLTLALFELRLEAARKPEIARPMGAFLRDAFEQDVAFNAEAGLPGGRREVALFHYLVDGLLFDQLTTPIDEDTSASAVVDLLVDRLMS